MQKIKRILLIDSTKHSLAMEGTLLVAGYEVLLQNSTDDIVQTCLAHKKAVFGIDLLIIELASLGSEGIQGLLNEKIADTVLYVDIRPAAGKPYHTEGNQGWLYQPSALLAAVKELTASPSREMALASGYCQ